MGSGTVWLDDVEVYTDGAAIGYSPKKEPLNADEKTWLTESSIDLYTDMHNNPIARLGAAIGDARIVAIGENTHGSGSVYKTQMDLAKYLIKNKGFTIISLEGYSDMGVLNDINRYLTQDKYALHALDIVGINPEESFIDFVEWLKDHNNQTENKVMFKGADIRELRAVISFINRESSGELKPQADTLREIMLPVFNRYITSLDVIIKPIDFTEQKRRDALSALSTCRNWTLNNLSDRDKKADFLHKYWLLYKCFKRQ